MFDLEKSIANWRQQMLADGIKTPVPLDELESHLREDIEQQTKAGLNEAEAFQTAVQKIGQGQVVQTEFEKVEEIKMTGEQKLWETTLVTFSILVPLLFGSMVLLKYDNLSDMTFAEQVSSLVAIALCSLLIWGGRLGHKIFPAIRAKRTRFAIGLSFAAPVMLWVIVAANIILPRYDFTMDQLMVVISWGFFVPMGAVSGLLWGMETAARKKVAMAGS
jgi:hypothetical protein